MGTKGSGKAEPARGRLQIYLDDDTKRDLRIQALKEGTTASGLVVGLIMAYLKTKRRG